MPRVSTLHNHTQMLHFMKGVGQTDEATVPDLNSEVTLYARSLCDHVKLSPDCTMSCYGQLAFPVLCY